MNKIISINLKGIIFQVEDEAYESLKKYLESLNRHFANEESKLEIIDDIESRLAEMMQERLKTKTAITVKDIEEIVAIMGNPDDFDQQENAQEPANTIASDPNETRGARRFYRDGDERILGGVCAGAGHYFGIDPLWVRLGFVLMFILAGTGLLFYGILWLIIPEAKTPSEKLQMKGEPVNADNISKAVKEEYERLKKNFDSFSDKNKSGIEGAVYKTGGFLRDIFTGLALFISKFVGICLLFVATVLLAALTVLIVQLIVDGTLPLFSLAFTTNTEFWLSVSAISLLLLTVIIGLTSSALLLFNPRRKSLNKQLGYTLSGLGVISLIVLGILGVKTATAFSTTQSVKENVTVPFSDTLVVSAYNPVYSGVFGGYDATQTHSYSKTKYSIFPGNFNYVKTSSNAILNDSLWCIAHFEVLQSPKQEAELEIIRTSYGGDDYVARAYASQIPLGYVLNNNSLKVNTHFYVGNNIPYRDQKIEYRLWLPEGKIVRFDQGLTEIMNYGLKNKVTNPNSYGMTWKMESGGLTCLDCKELSNTERQAGAKMIDVKDFEKVKVEAPITVKISLGNEYKVYVKGQENTQQHLNVKVSGNKLVIDIDREWWHLFKSFSGSEMEVTIQMPLLTQLEASGAARIELFGIKGDKLQADLSGACRLSGDVSLSNLELGLSGNSKAELSGVAKSVKTELSGSSKLEGIDLEAETYAVELSGACTADVWANNELEGELSGASKVLYKGTPKINVNASGASSVKAKN